MVVIKLPSVTVVTHLSDTSISYSSTNSRLPQRLYSSAPQLRNMTVLRGLQPVFILSPITLATSIIWAVPEFGSNAPNPQASLLRYFPTFLISYLTLDPPVVSIHDVSVWLYRSMDDTNDIGANLLFKLVVDLDLKFSTVFKTSSDQIS